MSEQTPVCVAPRIKDPSPRVKINSYCLSLQIDERPIGVLRISLDQNFFLEPKQSEQLQTLITVLAVVVRAATQRQKALDLSLTSAKESERRTLTHDLHDTLGQNLSFLRLKLENITRTSGQPPGEKLQKDLDQMLMVAAESCELVQETLVILDPDDSPPLGKILREYSEIVEDRSNLKIKFIIKGGPIYLPQQITRQVFYLFREAFSNIEKHASASLVNVSLLWSEKELEIHISDDGLGFNPNVSQAGVHFGLKSMRQRVTDLGGKILIESTPKSGTTLTVHLPIVSIDLGNMGKKSAPEIRESTRT